MSTPKSYINTVFSKGFIAIADYFGNRLPIKKYFSGMLTTN